MLQAIHNPFTFEEFTAWHSEIRGSDSYGICEAARITFPTSEKLQLTAEQILASGG